MTKTQPRGAAQKASDQRKIAHYYLEQKLTQAEIAEKLNLSQATVSRDVKAITKRNEADTRKAVDQWRDRVTASLAWIEDEARQGWERSKDMAITPKGVITPKAGQQFPGEASFLTAARSAVMDIWKVQGFDKLDDAPPPIFNITVSPVPARVKPIDEQQ